MPGKKLPCQVGIAMSPILQEKIEALRRGWARPRAPTQDAAVVCS